jgi:hypothetical protein
MFVDIETLFFYNWLSIVSTVIQARLVVACPAGRIGGEHFVSLGNRGAGISGRPKNAKGHFPAEQPVEKGSRQAHIVMEKRIAVKGPLYKNY